MTKKKEPQLELQVRSDRSVAWSGGGSVRHLLVRVIAPELDPITSESVAPLRLALCIDASGSMQGEPLAAAKRAAIEFAGALAPQDSLSIVSFSSDVQVHADAVSCVPAARRRLVQAIQLLETRENTDLGSGWLQSAECLARQQRERDGNDHRVVILSDGQANAGIVDPEILGSHAAQLHDRGLYSSAIGVGRAYSEVQLSAIARNGGGRLHHVSSPREISEVVMGELGQIRQTVADAVRVDLQVREDVGVEVLTAFPLDPAQFDHVTSVHVGSIVSRANPEIVFKLTCPRGDAGARLGVTAGVTWQGPGADQRSEGAPIVFELTFGDGPENRDQRRDVEVSQSVAEAWIAWLINQAIGLNGEGRFDQAAKLMLSQRRYFERYCDGLPAGSELVRQFEEAQRRTAAPIDEMTRKEASISYLKRLTYQRELRAEAPADPWKGDR